MIFLLFYYENFHIYIRVGQLFGKHLYTHHRCDIREGSLLRSRSPSVLPVFVCSLPASPSPAFRISRVPASGASCRVGSHCSAGGFSAGTRSWAMRFQVGNPAPCSWGRARALGDGHVGLSAETTVMGPLRTYKVWSLSQLCFPAPSVSLSAGVWLGSTCCPGHRGP